MALNWFLNSAYTIVLGQTCPNGDQTKEIVKKLENTKEKVSYTEKCHTEFQMPLHYPRYTKADYEKMEEWKVDMLLREYGLTFKGTLEKKKAFAIGAFLWPDQL